jgi:hypothetical protein
MLKEGARTVDNQEDDDEATAESRNLNLLLKEAQLWQ